MKRIIKRLTDPTLLHHYDTAMPLAIDVDTSIKGVGYVAYMYDPSKGPPGPDNAKLIKCGSATSKPTWANYSPIELEATGTLLAVRKLDHYIINNKKVVVHNDHLPFIKSYNTKDISQVSPRLRRIYLELAEHAIALTWKPAVEMVHVDAMSRNPVDSAEDMGPDPIDDQHQRLQDTINYIEEADDDEDHVDNIEVQGYQQAIKHRLDGDNIDRKELPTGAIEDVLEIVDICHMGFPKANGYAKASEAKPAEDVLPPAKFNKPDGPFEWMLDFGFSRVLQSDGARVFTEGRTTEGEARATWELMNQMPSRTALPAQGGEIEQGRKQQDDKEKEQGHNGDEQQAIDSMMQKFKAKGQEECNEE